jgi:large subunit ribosomal protein L1
VAEAKKPTKIAKKSQKTDENAPLKTEESKILESNALAKAGKRSAKATKEADAKAAKEERKKSSTEVNKSETTQTKQKAPRSRSERAGKKYREAIQQIEKDKTYNLAEAMDLVIKTSPTKFDATVEMHINLEVDPKQADQNIRDTVALPNGIGKDVKVAAFVEGEDVTKAQKAGADTAGSDEILAKLDKEQLDFDVLIATPALMSRLGKYARLLGPKGLMPNPKSGTVTADVAKAIKEAKAGRVEFRVDQSGIIHLGIGKASFGPQKLLENADAILSSVRTAKPASIKGTYIKSVYITSTMGPSVKAGL